MIDFYNQMENKRIEHENSNKPLPFFTNNIDYKLSGLCRNCKEEINNLTSPLRCLNCGTIISWDKKERL